MSAWIHLKIYKDTPDSDELTRARSLAGFSALSFAFQGHRWRYHMTSFDDAGEYDQIERPNPDYKESTREEMRTALQVELADSESFLAGELSFLRTNSQYWNDRRPTVTWLQTRIARLQAAIAKAEGRAAS